MLKSTKLLHFLAVFLFCLGVFLSASPTFAQCPSLLSFSDGEPDLRDKALSKSGYAPVLAQRLAQAKVLWVNFDLLRELGVRVPPKGQIPEFKQEILDAFAFAIPGPNSAPGTFLEKFKTYYADRYGGMGMNGNLGSGRAASAKKFQTKGIGPTTLVGKKADPDHAHGGLWMTEAIHEAQWSEILHRELPFGANRVLAILDTGTSYTFNGKIFPRALVIREDPLRPAQYLSNESVDGAEAETDLLRVKNNLKRLPHVLPLPPEKRSPPVGEKLKAGLFEFADRVAKQYAASFARSFYHGATSPSNIVLDAKAIDFGTQTAIDGFGKIKILDDERPFGDIEEQRENILYQIVDDVQKNISEDLKQFVPSRQEIASHFDHSYEAALKTEILALTGAPPELIAGIKDDPISARLQQAILDVASAGNVAVLVAKTEIPLNTGLYDLKSILISLAQTLKPLAPDQLPNRELRERLSRSYFQFIELLRNEAASHGIGNQSLEVYIREAALIKNRKTPDLYIGQTYWKELVALIDKAKRTEDDDLLQRYVDSIVDSNTRNFKDSNPYQLVISETNNSAAGTSLRTVFDAGTGSYYKILKIKAVQNKVNIRDVWVGIDTAEHLRYLSPNSTTRLQAVRRGESVEISIPVPHAEADAQLFILSPNGKRVSILQTTK